jgi:HPt (histidine-containing phosphotransfer) domain-containing protein
VEIVDHITTSTFSSEDLLAMVGSDDGMLCELRDIFEEEAPRVLQDIRDAVNTRDAAALEHHTHLMKNVVASVGGRASREIALALERAARAHDLGNTADLTDRLASEIAALRAALAIFITARIGE